MRNKEIKQESGGSNSVVCNPKTGPLPVPRTSYFVPRTYYHWGITIRLNCAAYPPK